MGSKNTIITIVIIALIFSIAGVAIGIMIYKNKNPNSQKDVVTYSLTLDDMYCNIKDSKKILKVKITLEATDKKTHEKLDGKQFLIRDDLNKIIRNKTEDDLKGKEGQVNLQEEIKESVIKLFNDENINNVYFNDFIIQ